MVVLCHSQEAGRTRQGAARGVAGAQGPGLQRGQDEGSSTSPRTSTSSHSTSAATAQAADQALQGGHQAAPGKARGRDAHPTRIERGGGHRRAKSHHQGMGGLLPGCGVIEGVPHAGHHMWKLTYKWATWRHRNKPKSWIVGRYFGTFNPFGNDRWVFGDRDGGAYLVKFSWTSIERHVPVKGAASPDDPALAAYWAERRKKVKPPLDGGTVRLLTRQARAVPAMRGAPAARRPATPVSRAVGTMVAPGHPQGDSPQLSRPRQETRLTGRCPNQPDTRLLLPRASRSHQQAGPGTASLHALAACISRVPRQWHARF